MIASSFGKIQSTQDPKSKINKNDISKSLMTMMVVNTLMISSMVAKIEKIKNVVWIGAAVNVNEYM